MCNIAVHRNMCTPAVDSQDPMTQSSYSSSSGLKAWIMAQIDGGMYPGLEWEDEEKTTFRIPWKHAGRQRHCNDVDSAIFKVCA